MFHSILLLAATFNLVCNGPMTTDFGDGKLSETVQQTTEFRVDLDKKRYCQDECNLTSPIEAVYETQIVFQNTLNEQEKSGTRMFVNRESGGLYADTMIGKFRVIRIGTCERSEFTGFPTKRF